MRTLREMAKVSRAESDSLVPNTDWTCSGNHDLAHPSCDSPEEAAGDDDDVVSNADRLRAVLASLQDSRRTRRSRVGYDHRHFMGNWFLMAHSKDSVLYKYFCADTSDAIFKLCEFNGVSERDRAKDHLRALGMSEADLCHISRRYMRDHCRYFVPEPAVLNRELTRVYEFWSNIIDPVSQRPFFNRDHVRRFKVEIKYVLGGYLSDPPPGTPMYRADFLRITTLLLDTRCPHCVDCKERPNKAAAANQVAFVSREDAIFF